MESKGPRVFFVAHVVFPSFSDSSRYDQGASQWVCLYIHRTELILLTFSRCWFQSEFRITTWIHVCPLLENLCRMLQCVQVLWCSTGTWQNRACSFKLSTELEKAVALTGWDQGGSQLDPASGVKLRKETYMYNHVRDLHCLEKNPNQSDFFEREIEMKMFFNSNFNIPKNMCCIG